ncbi:MAG: nitrous oxide reductase family maturation protein NosD [Candidatus Cyclobacteriaceae bacterium M2_1C_046]
MNRIALGLLLIFVSYVGFGKEILVCNSNCQNSSIQAAIDSASPGDTISILPGLYKQGTIKIDKKLVVRGIDNPVLDGENKYELIQVEADEVVVSGLTLQNTGMSYMEERSGIVLQKSKHSIVENNILKNTFFGIYAENSFGCSIVNNIIIGEAVMESSSGNAIHLWYSDSMKIVGNQALNHRDGIYLEFAKNGHIENNISKGNLRYGLHFMFSDNNQYIENVFEANGAGVAVMFSKNITMIKNKFRLNWGTASYGLLLKEIYDSTIENNEFYQNTIGIYAESVTRCNLRNNDFKRNGWAIKMAGSSMDNVITRNNFLSNTFDISTSAKRNTNTYIENYWSSYSGYDLDRNGYGDVPYRPVKLFSYIVGEVDASVLLLRSFFIEILDYAEKVIPSMTPADLIDEKPLMYQIK